MTGGWGQRINRPRALGGGRGGINSPRAEAKGGTPAAEVVRVPAGTYLEVSTWSGRSRVLDGLFWRIKYFTQRVHLCMKIWNLGGSDDNSTIDSKMVNLGDQPG